MKKSKAKMPPKVYNAMIDKVTGHKDGTVTVQMSLFGKNFTMTERLHTKPVKEKSPTEGHESYQVLCHKLCIYTVIGADNLHHASNKATKLFGPHWGQITQDEGMGRGYHFVPVAKFNELLKTFQI